MKHLQIACLVLLILMITACDGDSEKDSTSGSGKNESSSSDQNSQPLEANIVVKESGYLDDHLFAYVENRESREVTVDTQFTAYNSSGAKIDLSDIGGVGYDVLQPASTTLIAFAVAKDEIVRVTTNPKPVNEKAPKHGAGSFGIAVSRFELSSIPKRIFANVTNSYSEAVDNASATLMCKNAAGDRVAVATARFSAPAGGSVERDFGVNHATTGVTDCDAYTRITTTTEFMK